MATTTQAAPAVRRTAIVAAMVGVFVCLLDVNVVNVALPDIQRDLSGTLADAQWVVNLYVLALAALIIPAGLLGDVLGIRSIFGAAALVFGVGSMLCGLAGSLGEHAMTVLHIARFVQGLGGAFLLPLSLSLIFTYASPQAAPKLVGLWGAVGGLSTAIGPLVGGVLTDRAGWQWIFFVNVPVVIVIVTLLAATPSAPRARTGRRVPLLSAVVIGGAFFALVLGLTEGPVWGWASGRTMGLFALTVVLLAGVVTYERARDEPLVPRYLLASRDFQLSTVSGAVIGLSAFSMFFLISYYLQFAGRLTATETGIRFLPMSAALVVFAPVGARLAPKIGVHRVIAAGMAVTALGVAWAGLVALEGPDPDTNRLILPTIIIGIGVGLAFPSVSSLTVQPARRADLGVAASSGTMARQVGNALGVAVFGVIVAHYTGQSLDGGMAGGMRVVGIAAAVLLALGAVLNVAAAPRTVRSEVDA